MSSVEQFKQRGVAQVVAGDAEVAVQLGQACCCALRCCRRGSCAEALFHIAAQQLFERHVLMGCSGLQAGKQGVGQLQVVRMAEPADVRISVRIKCGWLASSPASAMKRLAGSMDPAAAERQRSAYPNWQETFQG